jgi:hypothetical protein
MNPADPETYPPDRETAAIPPESFPGGFLHSGKQKRRANNSNIDSISVFIY